MFLSTLGGSPRTRRCIPINREGTNVNEAKEMMANSGMKLISRDNLDEAARLAAKMSSIIGVAKEAGLNVSFDI